MSIVIYKVDDMLVEEFQLMKGQTCFPLALLHHQKQVAEESEAPNIYL